MGVEVIDARCALLMMCLWLFFFKAPEVIEKPKEPEPEPEPEPEKQPEPTKGGAVL